MFGPEVISQESKFVFLRYVSVTSLSCFLHYFFAVTLSCVAVYSFTVTPTHIAPSCPASLCGVGSAGITDIV